MSKQIKSESQGSYLKTNKKSDYMYILDSHSSHCVLTVVN